MCFKEEKNLPYLIDVTSIGGLSVFLPLFFVAILPGTATRGERNEKIILWEVKACQ